MNSFKTLTYDLLKKYNVQGPRYTSYPPAPSWSGSIGPKDYEQIISKSNSTLSTPLSLYLHLPFCEKLCYFCGCTTFITGKKRSYEEPYHVALKNEISWLGQRVNREREVIQFHLGGGTPTYSSPETLEEIMIHVKKYFSFKHDAEVGVEVDPRVTTLKHLETLRKLGFNRISMGVQDFNEKVQQAVNRIQSLESTQEIVDNARRMGFQSINIDLIFGLPHQTPQSFEITIDQILKINPDRLAVYSYAHVPWLKKHQDLFEEFLPDEKTKFAIFQTALKKFTESGYDYIGMDHFAKPTDEMALARKNRTLWRNFMGYTTKAGTDLFGLGVSAIGSVNGGYFQNQREIGPYQDAIAKGGCATLRGFVLSADDKIRSRVIQNLLCHAVVVKKEIEQEFSIQFDSYFKNSLEQLIPLVQDGLVEISKDEVRPTEIGRVFLRNIAMPFDAYLPKPGEKKVFSKTI